MTNKQLLEVLGDLVDALDVLNAHTNRIADTCLIIESWIGPDPRSSDEDGHLRVRIVNDSSEAVPVELMPLDDPLPPRGRDIATTYTTPPVDD